MTALTQEKTRSFEKWTRKIFPLAMGFKAFKHAAVGIDLTTGKVKPATAGATLFIIGVAAETVDAIAAEKPLNVNLCLEIEVENWASAGGISAANVGSLCYFTDDQTVTLTANGMLAGRIWAFDAARGVAVQKLPAVGTGAPAGDGGALQEFSIGGFVGGNIGIPDDAPGDSVIEVPPTLGPSFITLPLGAPNGTRLTFVADGSSNAHSVQYRDAAGPSNLTAPLASGRRHVVIALMLNGSWRALAYVSP